MSEEHLAVEIRDAFADVYEPNRGIEERTLAVVPWDEPRRRTWSAPRLTGAFAAAIATAVIVILIAPTALTRLNQAFPGPGGTGQPPAYSLAAVSGNSLFIVQRREANVLLQSPDGGSTWIARLRFDGVYDGMQMYGKDGFIWSIDMRFAPCGAANQPACQAPTKNLRLFRTQDGGATWTGLPSPDFAANGVFFLDGRHGWVDSGSPLNGLGNDTLYATTDGGQTWALVGALPQAAPMGWVYGVGNYHVTFSSPLRGWYLGNGTLFTTADGGHTWTLDRVQSYTFGDMPQDLANTLTYYSQPVFNGQEGILPVAYRPTNGPDNATANRIEFFSSHDGGATWSQLARQAPIGFEPVGDILAITILDPQHFWLTSQSESAGDNMQAAPAVARTSDGGVTWTVTHMQWRILQMSFRDATHGFAFDVTGENNVNGILKTSDGGQTWQRVNVPIFS